MENLVMWSLSESKSDSLSSDRWTRGKQWARASMAGAPVTQTLTQKAFPRNSCSTSNMMQEVTFRPHRHWGLRAPSPPINFSPGPWAGQTGGSGSTSGSHKRGHREQSGLGWTGDACFPTCAEFTVAILRVERTALRCM